MRKLTVVSAIFATLVGTPAWGAPNDNASQTPGYVDHCGDVIAGLPQSTLGECISFNETRAVSENGFNSHFCDWLEERFPEDFYLEYDKHSDCVRDTGE